MIVHPIFTLLGLNDGNVDDRRRRWSWSCSTSLLGLTALAIDRRALLVSALAYVLYALTELFKQFGAVELNVALTALVIGSALLLLSAFWHQARAADRHAAAANAAGAAADPRPAGVDYPTSRISRRSSGARTPCSSWPRLSTAPCSPTKRKRPLLQPKRGAFFDADLGPLASGGGRRRTRPRRDRSAAHNRANGRPRPSGRRGRGCASVPCGRKWRLGAGPRVAGTARRRSSALHLRLRLARGLERLDLLAQLVDLVARARRCARGPDRRSSPHGVP